MFAFLRFPIKLTFSVILALVIGFYCHLDTPRWAVMTAAVVAGGTALAAGGDPYSGAIRYRGVLRIIGTIIGCIAALLLMITTVHAPVLMLLLCCIWAGCCAWGSSLIHVNNAYAFSLAGYTTLIIVISAYSKHALMLVPQLAVERCSEIVVGIVCVILADILFSKRSIKVVIDSEVEALLVGQYRLLQCSVTQSDRAQLDAACDKLLRQTLSLTTLRHQLKMESAHWTTVNLRVKTLSTLSLKMITLAYELFLIQTSRREVVPSQYREVLAKPINKHIDIHRQLTLLRHLLIAESRTRFPLMLIKWVGTAAEYILLMKGILINRRVTTIEKRVIGRRATVSLSAVETHHAMINGLRTFIATLVAAFFWLYSGWTSGGACMISLAMITALAMRVPNPLMMAKDFVYGSILSLPLGALLLMVVMPATEQSMLLLCLMLGIVSFVAGIFIQRRQIGALGAFVNTLNSLVLSNPMQFQITPFLDTVLGQIIGSFLALVVIKLIRDKSKWRTGRKALDKLLYITVTATATGAAHRQRDHLPALYELLFLLLRLFPGDVDKYRLALALIISQQRLHINDIPTNQDLSTWQRQLCYTAEHLISTGNSKYKHDYLMRLLYELTVYLQKLKKHHAPLDTIESVWRLHQVLKKYQNTLIHI